MLSSSHPDPHYKVQEATAPASWPLTARLLRGAGGGTDSRGHSSSSSVRRRERERERQLVVVELGSAEEERQLHNQLRGCSLVCLWAACCSL